MSGPDGGLPPRIDGFQNRAGLPAGDEFVADAATVGQEAAVAGGAQSSPEADVALSVADATDSAPQAQEAGHGDGEVEEEVVAVGGTAATFFDRQYATPQDPGRESPAASHDPDVVDVTVVEPDDEKIDAPASGRKSTQRETNAATAVAVQRPEQVETIPLIEMLQEKEVDGLRATADVLQRAGSRANQSLSLAVTRGLTLANQHAKNGQRVRSERLQQRAEHDPGDERTDSLALPSTERKLPTFSLAKFELQVVTQTGDFRLQRPEPVQHTPPEEDGQAMELRARAELFESVGADTRAERAHFDDVFDATPRRVPHPHQIEGHILRALTDLKKKGEHLAYPYAHARAEATRYERRQREVYHSWEHSVNPDLPPTPRPDDVDTWEKLDARNKLLKEQVAATPAEELAAADDFEQARLDEQYLWDYRNDPPANGVRLPFTPQPHELTPNQRQRIYDQVLRTGNSAPHVAQAAVDEQVQKLNAERYLWSLQFLALNDPERARLYPPIPRPERYTPAQVKALKDAYHIQMKDGVAAAAEVEALVQEREQDIANWDRDYHYLQPGAGAAAAYTATIDEEAFRAMTDQDRAGFLSELRRKLLENDSQRTPKRTPEWIRLAKMHTDLVRIAASIEMDTSGLSRQAAIASRQAAGEVIPGYDPNLKTAVVFSGKNVDMAPVMSAVYAGCEQVFTVGHHLSATEIGRIQDELAAFGSEQPVNFQAASPSLHGGITADVVIVNPEAGGYVSPTDIPKLRQSGALIIAGSENKLILDLAVTMKQQKSIDRPADYDRALQLPGGVIQVGPDGRLTEGSAKRTPGVVFIAAH